MRRLPRGLEYGPARDRRGGRRYAVTLFGPHCTHDGCSMTGCDLVEPAVQFGCRSQPTCPHCGPNSPDWNRVAHEWRAWAKGRYETADSARLAELEAPENVVNTARLVESNPILREG